MYFVIVGRKLPEMIGCMTWISPNLRFLRTKAFDQNIYIDFMLPFGKDNFCKNIKKPLLIWVENSVKIYFFSVLAPKFLPDNISVNKITQISNIVLNALQSMSSNP